MFFLIQLPDGRTVQVRADNPERAVQLVKTAYSNQFGATDLGSITVKEAPSSQPYAPTTPALNFAVQDYPQSAIGGQQPGGGPTYNPNPGAARSPFGPGAPVAPLSSGGRQTIESVQGQPGTPQMPTLAPGTFGEETFAGAFQRALAGMGIDPTKSFFGAQIGRNQQLQGQLESTLAARRGLGLDQNIAGAPENRQLEATLASRGVPGNFGGLAIEALKRLQQGGTPGSASGYANPTTEEELNDLAQLALGGARSQLGGYFASRLLPGAGNLSQQFANQSLEDQQGGYLPYLKRRLGLQF